MGDLITLNCPSCGGNLEVNENTSVLTCKHCGSEHLVRFEGGLISLEAFARCPKCRRNDRVEKVTAILRNQVREIYPTIIQSVMYIDKFGKMTQQTIKVPKKPEGLSGLARLITLEYKDYPLPKYKSVNREEDLIIAGIIVIIISSCLLSSLILLDGSSFLSILSLLGVIIGIFLSFTGKKRKKSILEENDNLEQRYDNVKILWHYEYGKLKKAHDHLYYCHRDDCVFIPNKGTYAPVDDTMSYLCNNLET